ncbi:hypothetical protein AI27_05100 [Sphingomonas sp. BHC-A]|nr:hypothetical protein AI27_05100 [Sphingomonas sp. BHC-A]
MSDVATPAPAPSPTPAPAVSPTPAPAPSPTPSADALAAPAPVAPAAASWRDGLSDDLRGNAVFANYATLDDMAKGHIATKALASSKVPMPGDTAESFKAFADAIRPQDAAVYDITVPDGMPAEFADGFRKVAHESGLLPQQVKAIVDYNNAAIAADLQRQSEASAADLAAFKEDFGKAGGNFDQKLDALRAWLPQMGVQLSTEDMAALDSKIGSGNLMRFMFEMHDRVGDLPSLPGNEIAPGLGAMTPAQADTRLSELQKDASWRSKALIAGSPEDKENQRLTALVAQGRYREQQGRR